MAVTKKATTKATTSTVTETKVETAKPKTFSQTEIGRASCRERV